MRASTTSRRRADESAEALHRHGRALEPLRPPTLGVPGRFGLPVDQTSLDLGQTTLDEGATLVEAGRMYRQLAPSQGQAAGFDFELRPGLGVTPGHLGFSGLVSLEHGQRGVEVGDPRHLLLVAFVGSGVRGACRLMLLLNLAALALQPSQRLRDRPEPGVVVVEVLGGTGLGPTSLVEDRAGLMDRDVEAGHVGLDGREVGSGVLERGGSGTGPG